MRTQSLKVLPLKAGVDQNIAMQASSTTMSFSFSNFYLPGTFIFLYIYIFFTNLLPSFSLHPRSGELRTQKLKSHLVRTQSLNVLPLKPGVGQNIAIQATLTARDFFLAYFYPSGPFTCIFPKPLPIFPVLAVANTWFLCRPAE